MKLTEKEMQIMAVLWDRKVPMTAAEIIEASSDRTWKENSFYIMIHKLIEKGVVALAYYKPTITKSARTYKPAVTAEDYAVAYIESMSKAGIHIDAHKLIERVKEKRCLRTKDR